MSNLALTMDRKMIKSMNKRYKLFCSLSTNVSNSEAWKDIKYKPTRNIPKNILEEAQTAQALEGIASQETQLSVLSIIDNVGDEKLKKEEEAREIKIDRQMFGVGADGQQGILEETGRRESNKEP